jgi:hypothetical protein
VSAVDVATALKPNWLSAAGTSSSSSLPQPARPPRKGSAATPRPLMSRRRRLGLDAMARSTTSVRLGLRLGLETPSSSRMLWVMLGCSWLWGIQGAWSTTVTPP